MYLSSRGDRAGISKEAYGNLWFSRGGGPEPPPPLWLHPWRRSQVICIEYNAYSEPLLFTIFIIWALRPGKVQLHRLARVCNLACSNFIYYTLQRTHNNRIDQIVRVGRLVLRFCNLACNKVMISRDEVVHNNWAMAWDFQQCGMCDQKRLRPACATCHGSIIIASDASINCHY